MLNLGFQVRYVGTGGDGQENSWRADLLRSDRNIFTLTAKSRTEAAAKMDAFISAVEAAANTYGVKFNQG